MIHSFNRARNARKTTNSGVNGATALGNSMNKFIFMMTALVALIFTATGCDGNDEGVTLVTLDVKVLSPDCPTPDFCTNGLTLKLIGYDDVTDTPNPETDPKELELSFDSEGKAEGSLNLALDACYRMQIVGLPVDYKVTKGQGGFQVGATMCMKQGNNLLDIVVDDNNITTTPSGSGVGDVILAADGETGCAWDFGSDHLDATCAIDDAGATCNGIAKGSYTVNVSCANETLLAENWPFEVFEDADPATPYTVPLVPVEDVVDPPVTTGSACVTAVDFQGTPLTGCSYVNEQTGPVTSDPVPMGVTCPQDSLYIELDPGEWGIAAHCGNDSGNVDVTILLDKHVVHDIHVYTAILTGDLCSVDHAFIVDTYQVGGTLNVQGQVGNGDVNGGCNSQAAIDYTAVNVVNLSGPNCTDISDANCRLTVMGGSNDPPINGVYQHMLFVADFSGMTTDQLLIFQMGIADSVTMQSLSRAVWVYNGDATDF